MTPMRTALGVATAALLPALAGCSGWQSALDPHGREASRLADLIWGFTWICTAVWLLVMLGLAWALMRRRRPAADPLALDPAAERRAVGTVGVLAAITGVIVIGLTVLSFFAQRQLFAHQDAAVTIRVTGQQWWWDVRYEDPRPDRMVTTANEIHVPVGVPVRLKLASSDVIHSFWVPSLTGKMDLIPGQDNELQFVAERPGVYRGQCAEFCGLQHAHMGLLVVASPPAEFEAWRAAQLAPAAPPREPERQQGREVFLSKSCVLCHTVRGTPAGGRVAPDLTHLASRKYLAAATLPMSRGSLAAWVVDPHGIKPGVNMPATRLEPDELESLVSYLIGLQ
jgi:cytochrome c oxidase subunit 2